ncbi:HNH endonuclease family protein [Streptomyces sp. NPDC051976]|uniref:HNH endonuclease family protein n=1 Tax=Streptomyces sp. NPDC051976 TaxID=3154947 RepID=UPI0034439CB9
MTYVKRTLLVVLAAAALLGGTTVGGHAQESAAGPTGVWDLIAELRVAGEARDGYAEAQFGHWADADHDGCDTRAEVLMDEAVVAPVRSAGCTLTGGRWFSYYDDTSVDGPSGLEVDHTVPLAEAWDSGAMEWDADRREAYANDLDYPRTLVAVTAASHRAKGDQDPSTWLPSASDARCHYLDDWVAVKTRWNLAVDPMEQAALERLADQCPDDALDVPLA